MTTPHIYYGGTSRDEHLRFNRDMQRPIRLASYLTAGGVFCWGLAAWPFVDAAIWATAIAILTPLGFATQESWASPDNDESEKWERRHPFAERYWWLYGVLVQHRSVWSHSALGTATRILYGYWPMLALLLLGWGVAFPLLASWGIGCIVSDVCHYALDDFSPFEMVTGKK